MERYLPKCWAYSQEKEADNHHDQDQQEQIPLPSKFFCETRWNCRMNWRQVWSCQKKQDRLSLNRWRRNLTVKFHESDWNSKLKRLRIAKCCSLFKCSFSGFMTCSFQICFSFPSRILCSLPSSSSSLEEGLWFWPWGCESVPQQKKNLVIMLVGNLRKLVGKPRKVGR